MIYAKQIKPEVALVGSNVIDIVASSGHIYQSDSTSGFPIITSTSIRIKLPFNRSSDIIIKKFWARTIPSIAPMLPPYISPNFSPRSARFGYDANDSVHTLADGFSGNLRLSKVFEWYMNPFYGDWFNMNTYICAKIVYENA